MPAVLHHLEQRGPGNTSNIVLEIIFCAPAEVVFEFGGGGGDDVKRREEARETTSSILVVCGNDNHHSYLIFIIVQHSQPLTGRTNVV